LPSGNSLPTFSCHLQAKRTEHGLSRPCYKLVHESLRGRGAPSKRFEEICTPDVR
jgi:hypothetical protein